MNNLSTQPIAVIGMGCVLPHSTGTADYWQLLRSADRSAQALPPKESWDWRLYHQDNAGNEPDKGYSPLGGYIVDDTFAPTAAGLDPQRLEACGWMERWLIQALLECREGIGHRGAREVAYLGGSMPGTMGQNETALAFTDLLSKALNERGVDIPFDLKQRCTEAIAPSRPASKQPDRDLSDQARFAVRAVLGNNVPCQVLDAACASSLFAIEHGVRTLRDGSADLVWCGGFFKWGPLGQVLFSRLGGLTSKACTPFDSSADGTIFGDGAGVVALKRLADAERDGDKILGLVSGVGTASDGRGKAVYAPNSRGQVLAMQRAFADAGLHPSDIDYVIAHATGTPVGDATEYDSLVRVYGGSGSRDRGQVFLGSNKGNFGHLGWTAGVASLIQALLALREKEIPPQAGFQEPQAGIDLDRGPFRIVTGPVAWERSASGPRRVAVSGFGFGGTNAHVLVEEYLGPQTEWAPQPAVVASPRGQEFCVIAWSAMLPGASGREALEALAGASVAGRFPETPPLQGHRFRMPPPTQRLVDPAQQLLLRAAEDLLNQVPKEALEILRPTTGVFIASTGAGQMWVSHSLRIHRDLMRRNLGADPVLGPALEDAIAEALERFPQSGEDSFPGLMPNLLAGRIANVFDLHGINEVIDADARSFLAALEIACRALAQHDLTCALVGGSTPIAMDAISPGLTSGDEGTGLIALVRSETAASLNLPVVAKLRIGDPPSDPLDPAWSSGAACGNIGYLPNLVGLAEILDALARRCETACRRGKDGFQLGPTAQSADRIRRVDPCGISQPRWLPLSMPAAGSVQSLSLQPLDLTAPLGKENTLNKQPFHVIVDGTTVSTPSEAGAFLDRLYEQTALLQQGGDVPHFVIELHHGWSPIGPSALMEALESWVRGYAQEQPEARVLLLASSIDSLPKSAASHWWPRTQFGPVVAAWDAEAGWLARELVDATLAPSATCDPIGADGVVLVLGGGSGLGFAIARQLARRQGATVVLVGRSPLEPDRWYPDPLPSEGAFLAEGLTEAGGTLNVPARRGLYKSLRAQREKCLRTAELSREGLRWSYERCDVTDPEQVRDLVARVRCNHGEIDALIYSVIDPDMSPKRVESYDPDLFSRLWSSKVLGLSNVLAATKEAPPTFVMNASSISTLGIEGLVTYAAANAYQGGLLSRWAAETGGRVINAGWPGWAESGISHRIDPSRANADAATTFITDLEGADFADRMISDPGLHGTCWLLGAGERHQFATQLGAKPTWEPGPEHLPFVDGFRFQGETVLVKCELSKEHDAWLEGHRIGSDPVLPGTGLLELVAEAVAVATPQRRLWAMRDIEFHRFVKVSAGRPITLLVVVRPCGGSGNLWRVDIHSDLLDRAGHVLQAGRHHLGGWVETLPMECVPEAPESKLSEVVAARRFAISEPYLSGSAGIHLGGLFDTMTNLESSFEDGRGLYRGHLADPPPRLTQGILPLVFLDGALRLAALDPDDNGDMAVLVPIRLARLNLFQTGGDAHWSRQDQKPTACHKFSAQGLAKRLELIDGQGRTILTADDLQVHPLGKAPWSSPPGLVLPPLVRSILRRSALLIEALVPIDAQVVPHLATSAQLHGQVVLPGSWQMAIAAEVAGMLRPGWRIAAITEQSFASALKLQPGREAPLRVEARIIVDGEDQALIRCRLLSDMVHSSGTVLQRDRLHGSLNVELQASEQFAPVTPLPFHQDQAEALPWIPEVLYWPHSHLRLGQGFSAIRDTRDDGSVIECRYSNPAPLPELLGQLRLSPLLLDAMLQPVLPRHGTVVITGIPKAIRAVRFAANFNEVELRQNWGELIVRAQGDTEHGSGTRITVSTPAGEGLIAVEGFETYTLGAIDIPSGKALADTSPATLAELNKDDYAIPERWRRTWAPAFIQATGQRRPLANGRFIRVAVGSAKDHVPSPPGDSPALTAGPSGLAHLAVLLEEGLDRIEIHLDAGGHPNAGDEQAWPRLADELVALHQLSGVVLNRPGLLVQVVVHQATPDSGLAHAVMGWCRSLAKEMGPKERDLCRCWLVDGLSPSLVLAELAEDARQRIPFSDAVQWRDPMSVRTAHLVREAAVSADAAALTSADVVLITGGTGGIGLAAADALHRRYGCRLVLVGRTTPASAEMTLPERGAYAAEWRGIDGSHSVAAAMASFAALRRSHDIRDAIAELAARGARVEAMAADLSDPEVTKGLVNEILRRHGRIDAVIHLAGIDHSVATATKPAAIFQKVLASKMGSGLALLHALQAAESVPRIWVHGSSIMASIGMTGQTDYAAANAWLESFHHYFQSRHPGCRSILTEWTAWGGTGMLAVRPELWSTTRQVVGQRLGPEMGAQILIRELEALLPGPDPVLIIHPLPLETHFAPERRLHGPAVRPMLLDQVQQLGNRGWEGICHLSPERFRPLAGHSTDGMPSLPGSFELALAVDLLDQVLPSWHLSELKAVESPRFVKVPSHSVLPVRLRARLVTANHEVVTLKLELVSTFVHRSGLIMDRDRRHWSAEAELRRTLPAAPSSEASWAPSEPLRESFPAHYRSDARISYTSDLHILDHRHVDAAGHAWGEVQLRGWETQHPVSLALMLADAMAITPCLGSFSDPALHVNSQATERIQFFGRFDELDRWMADGMVKTHAWPCEPMQEGQFRCPRVELRNGRGEPLFLLTNVWFTDYGLSAAASSSAAVALHQVGV